MQSAQRSAAPTMGSHSQAGSNPITLPMGSRRGGMGIQHLKTPEYTPSHELVCIRHGALGLGIAGLT
jgi:hypothetical protein